MRKRQFPKPENSEGGKLILPMEMLDDFCRELGDTFCMGKCQQGV